MVAGDNADAIGPGDDQLEDAEQHFEPEPLVVEEIAEKDDARPGSLRCESRHRG